MIYNDLLLIYND